MQTPGVQTTAERHTRRRRKRQTKCLSLLRLPMRAACVVAVLASAAQATSEQREASRRLPFLTLQGEGDRFAVSKMTKPYEKDFAKILTPRAAGVDMADLDRYGPAPTWSPPDSTGDYDLSRPSKRREDRLTEEEKDQLDGPQTGVQVGIPSPVAITGTLLGGLGILIKILSEWR